MKNTLTSPLVLIIAFGLMFFLNYMIFGQTPTPSPKQGIDISSYTLGDWAQIGTLATLVGLIIWYTFSGKSREQLKEQAAGWKDTAERLRTEKVELAAKLERRETLVSKIRAARRKDRDIIYKMVARLEREEISIEDMGELWEEL